jgi:cytochrome c-type biogenesis protein CcmE
MKKAHILAIVIIAVAITVILSTAGDASTYVSFREAYAMAQDGKSGSIHVVGQLKKDASGQIVGVHPTADKLAFSFLLIDQNGEERNVFYNEPMPPDFLRSEQVVVIGSFQGQQFVADKLLMKCPSKYQEEELKES